MNPWYETIDKWVCKDRKHKHCPNKNKKAPKRKGEEDGDEDREEDGDEDNDDDDDRENKENRRD